MLRLLCLIGCASAWTSAPEAFLAVDVENEVSKPAEAATYMHVTPLSTTMKCTINLTLQYMVIFTALGLCRSYLDFAGTPYSQSQVEHALKHASETVFYAPMVCLLFVGFRMRVLQLTKGSGNPQDFVQVAMQAVAYSILANTLLVLLVPVFTRWTGKGEELETDAQTGDLKLDGKNPFENQVLATVFTCIRYLCFLGLYAGFGTVVYGLYTFAPPAGVWQGAIPPVSPAVACTCILSCAFFTIYCLLAASRTYSQFAPKAEGEDANTSKFEEVMLGGADTLAMAPMLCVLFLAARMRALQMDPVGGNPQRWAQNCFYACTYALMAQCCLAVAVPLLLKGTVKKSAIQGDLEVDVGEGMMAKVLTVGRWAIMASVYVGSIAVVCSVFTIEHPRGAHLTPAVSPTMQCVINFSFQYFFIYGLVWVFHTVKHFSGYEGLDFIRDAVESAKATVQFAPMLSVLFLATRMRALQITDQQGSPQGYVQDGMYLATWAVMIQFLMCLVLPFFTGKKYTAESLAGEDTKVANEPVQNYYGALTVTVIRYSALVFLLGGLTAVITGVFLMTPQNANGSGSIPVVGDAMGAPPSAADVPYVKSGMEVAGKGVGGATNSISDGAAAVNPVA